MRWFPDILMSFSEVEIDLYVAIIVGCFLMNVLTSLYFNKPSDETECSNQNMILEFVSLITGAN